MKILPWLIFISGIILSHHSYATETTLLTGQQLAFARNKGNCLACHVIADGEFSGNIGPKLTKLQQKFPNPAALREFIWNAGNFNPKTSMPPFGKNKILTASELDKIVAYLWNLD